MDKSEIRQILIENFKKYPLMEIRDGVKLIYQNEFGGGHMISDPVSCMNFLKEECESVAPSLRESEYIGNGIARVYLCDILKRNIPLEIVSNMFIFSSNNRRGSPDSFKEKLAVLKSLTDEGLSPFKSSSLNEFLKSYEKDGFKPIHHSEAFRKNYAPHYRVMDDKFLKLLPLIERAVSVFNEKGSCVISIDGRCASGKSTLGEMLSSALGASIIHADDFFLPLNLRTEKRLSQPGGNIHYEYFKERVADKIKNGEKVTFKPFNCHVMDFKDEIEIEKTAYTVIEGSYSHHPVLERYYDIGAVVWTDSETQMERIKKRNGGRCAVNFKNKWIPLEENYFNTFKIKENADIIIRT